MIASGPNRRHAAVFEQLQRALVDGRRPVKKFDDWPASGAASVSVAPPFFTRPPVPSMVPWKFPSTRCRIVNVALPPSWILGPLNVPLLPDSEPMVSSKIVQHERGRLVQHHYRLRPAMRQTTPMRTVTSTMFTCCHMFWALASTSVPGPLKNIVPVGGPVIWPAIDSVVPAS